MPHAGHNGRRAGQRRRLVVSFASAQARQINLFRAPLPAQHRAAVDVQIGGSVRLKEVFETVTRREIILWPRERKSVRW